MINGRDGGRDLSSLRVLRCGAVEATGDLFEPYRVVDVDGVVVAPVAAFLRDLRACGRPAATQRSYAMDLLRWFRFLRAVDVGWDQATRVEARDFCCWIQLAGKPGGPAPGARYAPATVAHCETVLRGFYDFHLEAGTGPMVNPFPLARGRRGRTNAHRSPDWLEAQPGDTWQDRWITSGADAAGNPAWRGLLAGWLAATGRGPRDPEHVSLLAGRSLFNRLCERVQVIPV